MKNLRMTPKSTWLRLVMPCRWFMKASRLGSNARKMRRINDGKKLVSRPLMTGRLANVLNPGVLCILLTCRGENKFLFRHVGFRVTPSIFRSSGWT